MGVGIVDAQTCAGHTPSTTLIPVPKANVLHGARMVQNSLNRQRGQELRAIARRMVGRQPSPIVISCKNPHF